QSMSPPEVTLVPHKYTHITTYAAIGFMATGVLVWTQYLKLTHRSYRAWFGVHCVVHNDERLAARATAKQIFALLLT
ncbi:hypothetical protein RZS08_28195, partial [Arthrospira platensis SPKY1]|nr:hypothetical protein [Arthrospira platensis SPKY1]